jgi:putative FmdB family regulatory protein
MPIYDYGCTNCKKGFSVVADKPPKIKDVVCPNCGSDKIFREWNAPPVIFKGKGFYTTDNSKDDKK